MLAFSTQVRGFKPGRSRWIFKGEKILSTPSFRGEVKPSVPCRRFAACKRSLELRGSRILDEICRNISRPRRSFFYNTLVHFNLCSFCIPRSFPIINVCNQRKTLCSPCTFLVIQEEHCVLRPQILFFRSRKRVITDYPHTTRSPYRDSLWEERSGDRIKVEARFSAPVQIGHGSHPASYTMGTWSFPGLMGLRRGTDHPSQLQPRFKKGYSCTSTHPLCFHGLF